MAEIEGEVAYWQNAVICYVLGANPSNEVIAGVERIWSDFTIDKVLLIKKDLYLVRFNKRQAAMTVAQKGVYYFDQKPFTIKAWTPKMAMNINVITSLPLWIQLPELDIKY